MELMYGLEIMLLKTERINLKERLAIIEGAIIELSSNY